MDQPGTIIESELFDLTAVSLQGLRGHGGLEWNEIEQRLLQELCSPAALAGDSKSWTM